MVYSSVHGDGVRRSLLPFEVSHAAAGTGQRRSLGARADHCPSAATSQERLVVRGDCGRALRVEEQQMPNNRRSTHTLRARARDIERATDRTYDQALGLLRVGDTWRARLASVNPSKRDVELAARIAVARAFGGRVDGRCVVGATVNRRSGLKLAVACRHERGRGHGAMLDALRGGFDPSWDAMVFVRFAKDGSLVVVQLLDRAEVAAYRAAGLPRHDRLAFNETSFQRPDGTWYGADFRKAVRPFLNWPVGLPMP